MDSRHDLTGLIAARVELAWQSETAYERLAADHGIGADHASHLLRFAVQRIADGTASTVDPYVLASSWIRERAR